MSRGRTGSTFPTDQELRDRWRNVAGNVLSVTEEEATGLVAGGIFTATSVELSLARILAYRAGVARRSASLELDDGSEVSAYLSDRDGAVVVEIDAPAQTAVRVHVNDDRVATLVVPD